MNIDISNLIQTNGIKFPNFVPAFAQKSIYYLLNKLIKTREINKFINENEDKYNFDFIEELFEYLNFSYFLSGLDKLKIPSEGKLIIVANHPLGALDGLALIKAVSEIRKDVLIVANDLLLNIENLRDIFLPYNIFSLKAQKNNIQNIEQAITENKAVIFFPSAVVSRMSLNGVKDSKWHKGAVKFSKKFNAPILPVLIEATNSFGFYLASLFNKKISTLLLPRELFKKRNTSVKIKVGNLIPVKSIDSIKDINLCMKILKKHTYKLAKNKEIFRTERNVIRPVDNKYLKEELNKSKLLGTTADGKKIYCTSYAEGKSIIKEIARLREITFRKVGEGTGNKFDFDKFDKYYKHIVLWNDNENEIIGSYRLGVCREIIDNYGAEGLYNSEEFKFTDEFIKILPQSIELGRSFIQEKYWKTNALDSLWQGIGLYVQELQGIKYFFGAVSISESFSNKAKDIIIGYCKKWFSGENLEYIIPHNEYTISQANYSNVSEILCNNSPEQDFKSLKTKLKEMNCAIPVMFRRYTEICEANGVKFLGYNLDKNFSNCVDGFILLDITQIKKSYKLRYKFIDNALSNTVSIDMEGNLANNKLDKATSNI